MPFETQYSRKSRPEKNPNVSVPLPDTRGYWKDAPGIQANADEKYNQQREFHAWARKEEVKKSSNEVAEQAHREYVHKLEKRPGSVTPEHGARKHLADSLRAYSHDDQVFHDFSVKERYSAEDRARDDAAIREINANLDRLEADSPKLPYGKEVELDAATFDLPRYSLEARARDNAMIRDMGRGLDRFEGKTKPPQEYRMPTRGGVESVREGAWAKREGTPLPVNGHHYEDPKVVNLLANKQALLEDIGYTVDPGIEASEAKLKDIENDFSELFGLTFQDYQDGRGGLGTRVMLGLENALSFFTKLIDKTIVTPGDIVEKHKAQQEIVSKQIEDKERILERAQKMQQDIDEIRDPSLKEARLEETRMKAHDLKMTRLGAMGSPSRRSAGLYSYIDGGRGEASPETRAKDMNVERMADSYAASDNYDARFKEVKREWQKMYPEMSEADVHKFAKQNTKDLIQEDASNLAVETRDDAWAREGDGKDMFPSASDEALASKGAYIQPLTENRRDRKTANDVRRLDPLQRAAPMTSAERALFHDEQTKPVERKLNRTEFDKLISELDPFQRVKHLDKEEKAFLGEKPKPIAPERAPWKQEVPMKLDEENTLVESISRTFTSGMDDMEATSGMEATEELMHILKTSEKETGFSRADDMRAMARYKNLFSLLQTGFGEKGFQSVWSLYDEPGGAAYELFEEHLDAAMEKMRQDPKLAHEVPPKGIRGTNAVSAIRGVFYDAIQALHNVAQAEKKEAAAARKTRGKGNYRLA